MTRYPRSEPLTRAVADRLDDAARAVDAPQPHVIGIDITQDDKTVMADSQRGVAQHPGAPFIDDAVFAGQRISAPTD